MFYNKDIYFNEINDYIQTHQNYERVATLNSAERVRIDSDLRISLVIKCTGCLEVLFNDIFKSFAFHHSSVIFHKYFENNFTNKGKNLTTDNINGLLKVLGVDPIKKEDNPRAFTSIDSLYSIRNEIAHGNISFTEPSSIIINYIISSVEFINLVIERLDQKCY